MIKIVQDRAMRDQIRVFVILAVCVGSFALCVAQSPPPQRGVIQVDVVGLRNNKGQISCALYASAEGFPELNLDLDQQFPANKQAKAQ